MKKAIVAAIVLAIIIGGYVAFVGSLRGNLEATLSAAAQRPVTIGSAKVAFPPSIRLADIRMPKATREPAEPLSIEEIRSSFALGATPSADIHIVGPKLWMQWNEQSRVVFSALPGDVLEGVGLPLKTLSVENGALTIVDQQIKPETDWRLRAMEVDIDRSANGREYNFMVSGNLETKSGEVVGAFDVEGNTIIRGPTQMKLTVSHKDVNKLSAYLRPVLGPTPVEGGFQLVSQVTINEGLLVAQNQLTAKGIRFSVDEPTKLGPEGNELVDLLTGPEGDIRLGFIVSGKIKDKLKWTSLVGSAMREAMRQALARSIQRVLIETEKARPVEEMLRRGMESLGR